MRLWWFLIAISVAMGMEAIAIMVPINAMLSDEPDCVWCGWHVAEFVQKIEHPAGRRGLLFVLMFCLRCLVAMWWPALPSCSIYSCFGFVFFRGFSLSFPLPLPGFPFFVVFFWGSAAPGGLARRPTFLLGGLRPQALFGSGPVVRNLIFFVPGARRAYSIPVALRYAASGSQTLVALVIRRKVRLRMQRSSNFTSS